MRIHAPIPESPAQLRDALLQTDFCIGYTQFGPVAQYCARGFLNTKHSELVVVVNKAPHLLRDWLEVGTAPPDGRAKAGVMEQER